MTWSAVNTGLTIVYALAMDSTMLYAGTYLPIGCPSLFCARRGGGSCSRRMGFTLALTQLSFGASRRRRRSEAGRDTMLPRQSQRLDTDDTDDTDPTDRNGQKAVGAARVYPCPMPWSV